MLATLLAAGCGGKEESKEEKNTLPQADQLFDKSKVPVLKAGPDNNKQEKASGE